MIKNAQIAEGGASVSLEDAQRITTTDVRFPSNPRSAEEKLYRFSIIVDLFHGVGHPVSNSIRNMTIRLGPAFHRLADQYADTPTQGMDLVCRVLYDIQQDYFRYIADVSNGLPGVLPDFRRVIDLVESFRADSLSALPAPWYNLVDAPTNSKGN